MKKRSAEPAVRWELLHLRVLFGAWAGTRRYPSAIMQLLHRPLPQSLTAEGNKVMLLPFHFPFMALWSGLFMKGDIPAGILNQHFSHFSVNIHHLMILLQCRLWRKRPRVYIFTFLPGYVHTVVADPRTALSSMFIPVWGQRGQSPTK